MPAIRSRAPRSDALRNEVRVIDAARAVFGERGPGAGMEEIAARAGVGVGTIYRRFPNKDALLDAVAAQMIGELEQAADDALGTADAGQGLESFLDFVGQFNAEKLRFSAVLVERVGARAATGAMIEKVEVLTRQAVASGYLASDVEPSDINALMRALRGVIEADAPDGDGWRRFLRRHLAGLKASGI